MKAVYQGVTVAESDATIVVEGNHYFPADSLNHDHLREANHTTFCGWKGTANF